MILNETPYIKLRKANGLINIDYTACDILGLQDDSTQAAARSYTTIIGVYTKTRDGKKIYLENAYSYSPTTAGKHKPRAAALAIHNGYNIIPGIEPQALFNLYHYNQGLDAILQEVETRAAIVEALHSGQHEGGPVLDAKKKGTITPAKNPEPVHVCKNGNTWQNYYYKTNFKLVKNINYKVTQHGIKKRTRTRNGPASYLDYKYKVVIYSF